MQFSVVAAEEFQFRNVMLVVIGVQESEFHQPRMNDQEHQHVHGAVPRIVEFLLFDGTGYRSADGYTFQDLESGDLIDTHHPDALFGQPRGMRIAPQNLLRSLFEGRVQAGGLPITSAMGLQSDIVQEATDRCGADRRDYAIVNRLTGQVSTRPVRDCNPLAIVSRQANSTICARCTGVIRSSLPERLRRPSTSRPSNPSRR